ncbi:General secretion pathway protein G [Granulibacter bethesdensis]|uniref:Type II secretion system core protein G n=1 Tax=Granulibacter bethesdensis TaxID=364410 RepID=A0AAC9KF63_9PROT|nr:type II secretion system major pseudopilin GspG [Granulibacter bethesdensis]APH55080.1 General secretion pathway protein G [Granulibacter bethesdensis]APH62666.1 General secretion pathway protein G [Granulibacter bethesdensis]
MTAKRNRFTFVIAGIRFRLSPQSHIGQSHARSSMDAGFTLIEMLVVIAILGILVGLAAPAVLRQLGGARQSVARQAVQRIGSVLDLYRLDMGNYPSTSDGLGALVNRPATDADAWNGPYLKDRRLPQDPWNHPFLYRSPSAREEMPYDLCSRGEKNVPGDVPAPGMICNE